ncbi:MAG TPA: class I SAM-dependent methyltransferase [Ktedonobacteraceae bacterium]
MSKMPDHEHPSTYFVQDRENLEEMTRLQIQDQMLTASMGGVLPEQSDPTAFQRVLDVGCGTGGWLIEAARTYPMMTRLVGVDVSKKMIDYARAQAEAQQVEDRVEFHVMDALRMLEFPAASFDLINQRLGVSFLRTWDWPKLLGEYQRVGRYGAVIRITESDIFNANTPAFTQLSDLFLRALAQAGHLATPQMDATISVLPSLLSRYGIQQVHSRLYELTYRAGTPGGEQFAEDAKHTFRTLVPFFRKWTRVPENYDELYQQMLDEMKQPDFEGRWTFLTAWGINQAKDKHTLSRRK